MDPASETETYVAARLTIDDWRWSGVPFYLRMGKRLPKRATEIAIQFKEVPHRLFKDSATRPRGEPARDADPARRGDHAALRGQGPGPGHRRPQRDDGLHLRVGVPDRQPGRVRDADPRRAPGRRLAVHARGRGRGGVVHRGPDHRGLGRDARRRTSPTTRRAPGAPRPPTTCSPGRGGGGGGSERRRPTARRARRAGQRSARSSRSARGRPAAAGSSSAEPPRPGEPTMRWLSTGPDDRRHREGAGPDLGAAEPAWSTPTGSEGERRRAAHRGADVGDEPRRRRAPAGDRRAERPRRSRRLTGRHPSRTLIVLSADPDGPPWLDARIQAHCVLPRADAPETCSEQIFLTAGGETGRHLSALVAPLLIHDLPVTVWWPGEPPLAVGARAATCSRRRTASWSTRRPGPATALARLRQLARPVRPTSSGCRSATSRSSGSRAGARRSRPIFDIPEFLPYLAQHPADRGDLRDPRRDRRARDDQRRQAAVPRRVAGLAAGHARRGAAGAGGAEGREAPRRHAPAARREAAAPPRARGAARPRPRRRGRRS